jgi:mannose-6-phosphate isomerase-like protein (cupin superfamily)
VTPNNRHRFRFETVLPSIVALALGLGWATRELAIARELDERATSRTITLDEVKMNDYRDQDKPVGKLGVYIAGETPASSKFATGRFVLDAGKSPHPPHVHPEEEVLIVETGQGEIVCDGKTTKVGPGSVMFTAPNAPHGITNTGTTPLVFYFVKWAEKGTK